MMLTQKLVAGWLALCIACWIAFPASAESDAPQYRILVVDSYHPEFIWSQQTQRGLVAGLQEFGYLDNMAQGTTFSQDNEVSSRNSRLLKLWMDSKRKNSRQDIAKAVSRVISEIDKFNPDLILLGDDNAAKYIGNHYIDSEIPIVFWGINGVPLKYGLLDSLEKPGHNVTGIYQGGYHVEIMSLLRELVPGTEKVAVLSDDSPTGRSDAKMMQRYDDESRLPVTIEQLVITNSFEEWKQQALELKDRVDAFYITTHNTLKNSSGEHVDYLDVAAWYLNNIHKPEVTPARFFVQEGFLATVEDSGFKQGYEAMKIANRILAGGESPATITSYAPDHGPIIVNRARARKLGLDDQVWEKKNIVDEWTDDEKALSQTGKD